MDAVTRKEVEKIVKIRSETLFKLEHLCVYLRLSENTVRRLMDEGMPYCKFGGLYAFNTRMIEQWLQQMASTQFTEK